MKISFNIAGLLSKLTSPKREFDPKAIFDVKEDQFIQKEGYEVRITRDCRDPELNKFCIMEERTRGGKLDCADEPSIFYVNKFTGQTYRREFYKDGKLHRDDGPAIIEGDIYHLQLSWYKDGKLHRDDDLPAYVQSIPAEENRITCEAWWVDGKHHRENGPAEITYSSRTGKKGSEAWYLNGQSHRIGGPQLTSWIEETGEVFETYAEYGELVIPERNSYDIS